MVFGLFKKDNDTSNIDALLAEIDRLGRRMGGLVNMAENDRADVVRVFKLDIIINSVSEMKLTLLDARNQVQPGKIETKQLSAELSIFRQSLSEYHQYLNVLNEQGNDEEKFFIERPGIESYFNAPNS